MAKRDYNKADVFIRIRPENKKEKKYKAKGKEKFLADFDSQSVTIGGRKVAPKEKLFDYPKQVLGPSCNQEDAYVDLGLEDLLDKFLYNNQDACILAYGQTGSGKTHTVFGDGLTKDEIRKAYLSKDKHSESSSSSQTNDDKSVPEGWGIFPRAVISALEKIKDMKEDADSNKVLSCIFSASVIEMYFGEIKDLLNNKKTVPVSWYLTGNKDFDFDTTKKIRIESLSDLQKLIEVVFTERQSRGTQMNDASSRSHCLTTLFVTKILEDQTGKKFVSESLMQFVDLSGSERTVKTGLEGKQQIQGTTAGMEGIMINLDLWSFGYAVDAKRKIIERRGKNSGQLSDVQKTESRMKQFAFPSVLNNLLSRTINGETNCVVVMCISPSPYNGSETAFTIDFGERLSHLPSNPLPSKIIDYDTALKSVHTFLEENIVDSNVPEEKMNRFQVLRATSFENKKKELEFLEKVH